MALNSPDKVALLGTVNDHIMEFDVSRIWHNHSKATLGLNPWYMEMRQELEGLDHTNTPYRHVLLKKIFNQTIQNERRQLREVGLDYLKQGN